MLTDIGINLLAKAYSVECLKHLPFVITNICSDCHNNLPSPHPVCNGNIPDQLYFASDILTDIINEPTVSDLLIHFTTELHLPVSFLSDELFDIPTRHEYLADFDFWNLISSYALPWAEPPLEEYIDTDSDHDSGIASQ